MSYFLSFLIWFVVLGLLFLLSMLLSLRISCARDAGKKQIMYHFPAKMRYFPAKMRYFPAKNMIFSRQKWCVYLDKRMSAKNRSCHCVPTAWHKYSTRPYRNVSEKDVLLSQKWHVNFVKSAHVRIAGRGRSDVDQEGHALLVRRRMCNVMIAPY